MTIYFAWVDPPGSDGAEFGPEHVVFDERVIDFEIRQDEGDFAILTANVENPRVGPLAAGRQNWAWLSWQQDGQSDVVPLFFGRMTGIPRGILGNIITYEFRARPPGYEGIKADLAETLRVLPYYDELFIDQARREDSDVVLEGYTKAWHIDRITHEVTVSDFLVGEDGVVEFSGSDIIDGSLDLTLDRMPQRAVAVDSEFPWAQSFSTSINLPEKTWQGKGFNSWPKVGDSLAGGYIVTGSSIRVQNPDPKTVTINFNYQNDDDKHRDGDVMSISESLTDLPGGNGTGGATLIEGSYSVNGDPSTGTPASGGNFREAVAIAITMITAGLSLGVDAGADRNDAVSLTLESDLQPVFHDPDEEPETEVISLGASNVADECSGEAPIGNLGRSQYVTTDRGLQSLQHMIMLARARLTIGARVVSVTSDCSFAKAVELSCRKNAYIVHPNIPGEAAIGKIVFYSLRGSGTGEFRGSVKISCAIGLGNAITTADGEADYVDEDYVDDEYQTFTGQIVALPSLDVGFSPPVLVDGGGGFAFPHRNDLVISDEIVLQAPEVDPFAVPSPVAAPNTAAGRQALLKQSIEANTNNVANHQSYREVELVDLTNQSIDAEWTVPVTVLVLPRQIDLTAPQSV
jgi:hypothetical protein